MSKDLFMRMQLQLVDKVSSGLSQISRSTQLNSEALKANRNHLRNLEKAAGLATKLGREQEAFKRTNTEMRANQAQLIALKKSGSATAAQIKAQTTLVKKSAAAFDAQKNKLLDLRRVARDAGIKNLASDQKRLSTEIKNTTAQITRQDAALRRMDQLRNARNQALGTTAAIGGAGMGMRMIGQRGLNVSRSVLSQGLEFDTGMAALQGQMNLAGDSSDLARLRAAALSQPTKHAGDMTTAMSALAAQGMKVDHIIANMPTLITAADASLMSMEDTATSFGSVMKAFNLDFNDFAQVSDLLVGAGAAGNLSIQSLSDTLASVAPNAKAAGLSLNQTAAMISAMNLAGIDSKDAGSSLDAALKTLQNPNQKALASIGIHRGQAKDVPELLQMIAQKTSGMSSLKELEHLNSIFGKGNSAAMQQLMNQMRTGGYDNVLGKISNSDGAASTRAAQNTGHLKNHVDDLTGSIASLGTMLLEMNKDWLQDAIISIKDTVLWVRTWIKANPELTQTLSKLFIGGSALLTLLGTLAMGLAGILAPTIMLKFGLGMLGIKFGGLIPIILNVGKAMFTLGTSLMANPVFLAIGLLAAAAYLIYKNWDSFVWFFDELWSLVTGVFTSAVEGITSITSGLWESITGFFNSGIANITATLVDWSPLGLFYTAFADVLSWFGVDLPASFTGFGGMLMEGLINGITGALGTVKDTITNVGSSTIGWFKETLGIASPSKVFIRAGTEISNGAAVGITQGLPVIKKASRALADEAQVGFDTSRVQFDRRAPISSMSASQGSGSAPVTIGGDTYHFNITGPDTAAIQQMLRAELEKIQRQKQAFARSRYHDF